MEAASPGRAEPVAVNVEPSFGIVNVVTSVKRGRHPHPGIQYVPYHWRDVIEGSPPRRRTKGEGAYCVYHHTEIDEDVRVTFSTVVSIDPGIDLESTLDDLINVDVKVTVQKRFMQELIDREKRFSDRLASRLRTKLTASLQRRREGAHGTGAWARFRHVTIKVQAKVGMAGVRTLHKVMRGSVTIPDAIVQRSLATGAALGGRTGRRVMRKGVRDPTRLTNEEKGVLLFLATIAIAATILVATFALAIADVTFGWSLMTPWVSVLKNGGANVLGTLGVPLPSEVLLILAIVNATVLLATVAIAASFVGRLVGCWLVYLLGDSLNHEINKKTKKSPRMKRAVDWLNRNAEKRGFALLVILNALPLIPDVVFYVFAVSGMKFRKYMGGMAVGNAIKFAWTVALVLYFREAAQDIVEHPIAHLAALIHH
ncbi:MAG: associated Golgi protein [Thermoplasmata archaeon]|nr:associated Golgi protein [Thermoplasmata archaeon]